MLPQLFETIDSMEKPILELLCNREPQTGLGAFPYGTQITFRMRVPRRLGAAAVVLRYAPDQEEVRDLALNFSETSLGIDIYEANVNTADLFPPCGGLLYYEFLFLRGEHTLFTNSINNLDFSLEKTASRRFRMLVYRQNFETPRWFSGGTMYHIFLDRFYKGNGPVSLPTGASVDKNWETGVPQYPEKPGDALSNNVFFGGNLWGVCEKLDFLSSLGVTVLYLSPIFRAASNHRYDTGSYEEIDPLLGGEEAFEQLIRQAHAKGIRIILDGVFNHTGDDSLYFNRRGNYPSLGAYQSEKSPYYHWFNFRNFPDDYECWWGIEILPRLNHDYEPCRRYFTGRDGIAAHWMRRGIDGWRLDVADELSDEFLDEFRSAVKENSNEQGMIIGEVWENAAEKIAYGKRRRYLCGDQLDSVMNYPFRNAVLALLLEGDTEEFVNTLTEIYASYPKAVSDCLMNLLSTHDTERILTLLGDGGSGKGLSNAQLAQKRLSKAQRKTAIRLLKIASVLQFTVFGVPSIYYGDESGLEGYHDPFCRMPYPWTHQDEELLSHYRLLGRFRQKHPALDGGSFRFLFHRPGFFLYERKKGNDRVLVALNIKKEEVSLPLPGIWIDCIHKTGFHGRITLPACSCALLVRGQRGTRKDVL